MDHIRAFIATPLPDSIKAYLGHIQKQLKSKSLPNASWLKPASMHLTLKFLGTVNTGDIKIIRKCMETTVSHIPQFTLVATHLYINIGCEITTDK